jgi:hypothetical protein
VTKGSAFSDTINRSGGVVNVMSSFFTDHNGPINDSHCFCPFASKYNSSLPRREKQYRLTKLRRR